MRIAVISTPVFAVGPSGLLGYGGLEHIAWLQAKGLAAKGHTILLAAPEGSSCPGCEIIGTGAAGTWDEKAFYGSYWQRLADVDVVIDSSWQKWSYVGKEEGWLKAPVLGVCHAPVDTMYRQLPPVEKPCFVCISEDQAAHFTALFSRPVRVAYNGVDLDHYRSLGVPRTGRYLFLARFSTIKGPSLCQDVCLAAGAELDLVGDTQITGEPEYLEQCRRKADGRRIRIVGGVSRGETVHWYSRARAMLHLNKLFREPFGLAPVESQACSCPVIAWNHGAMRETIKHGETGFLVTSMEEAIDLIRRDAVVGIDRGRCREHVSQFSVQRMVNRYEELCHEAIQTGGW